MRALRTLTAAAGLMLILASCEMTVRFTTVLDADGAGRFSLGIVLDQEAREQIDVFGERYGEGIASIEELFDGLAAAGWEVTRSEPDGGLAFEATEAFANPDDFSRVLAELRSARAAEDPSLTQAAITLDVDAARSFFRSTTEFSGEFDTTLPAPADPDEAEQQQALVELIRRVLRIEVRAELPASAATISGPGSASDGVVVWTPEYGTATPFGATTSSLRLGSVLMVLIPSLILLGVLGVVLVGRRRTEIVLDAPGAIDWERRVSKRADDAITLVDLDPAVDGSTNGHASASAPRDPST